MIALGEYPFMLYQPIMGAVYFNFSIIEPLRVCNGIILKYIVSASLIMVDKNKPYAHHHDQ